jgi:hypothetical protein
LKVESFIGWALEKKEVNISLEENGHWFSLIEGRKLYWVGIREKRSQYKLRRK